MMRRIAQGAVAVMAVVVCMASWAADPPACAKGEAEDFGVAPRNVIQPIKMVQKPTPTHIDFGGIRVIGTAELRAALDAEGTKPIVVEVRPDRGKPRRTVAGAAWLPDAGAHDTDKKMYAKTNVQDRVAKDLERLTGGERGRALVFVCLSPKCWVSHNAALRAARAGYTNVHWYRGGAKTWKACGHEIGNAMKLDRYLEAQEG